MHTTFNSLLVTLMLILSGCSQQPQQTEVEMHPKKTAIDIDFDLCTQTYSRIIEHYGEPLNANELPESHQTVLLVEAARGIIGNGGFEYLFEGNFEGDPGFQLTLKAFERIGCDEATDALRKALALFPDGVPIVDVDARIEFYTSRSGDIRGELDFQFWDASKVGQGDITIKLAKYIRAHEADYLKLAADSRQ